jgi:glycosyltransferase involved in cell wall biosynthesis
MFIVWAERHRGTRSAWLAEALGIADLRYIAPTRGRGRAAAPRKYPAQFFITLWGLIRARPRVVFVQSPPSFASWTAAAYAVLTGGAFVIDAHSDAFGRSIWTRPRWLNRLVARRAVATIVTNEHWVRLVTSWGAKAVCVPNIPITFPAGEPANLGPGPTVAVVNTWAGDEPLDAVLSAAERLPDVTFLITGRDEPVARLGRPVPENARFTGFLSEDDYHALLRGADAVVCLTTRDHTMQNGACEALAHGTPIVTSDWAVLRDYFSAGTAHVDNTPEGIAAGIASILGDLDGHRAAIDELRARRRAEWQATRRHLIGLVNGHVDVRSRRSADPSAEESG